MILAAHQDDCVIAAGEYGIADWMRKEL